MFRFSLFLGLTLASCSLLAIMVLPNFQWAKESWILVASMTGLLSLPLAISGLNTWLARLNVSIEEINAGVWYQVLINSLSIALLFICSKYSLPFSSALALSISALLQFFSIPIFQKIICKGKKFSKDED